jgi:hypothetical protein
MEIMVVIVSIVTTVVVVVIGIAGRVVAVVIAGLVAAVETEEVAADADNFFGVADRPGLIQKEKRNIRISKIIQDVTTEKNKA